MIVCPRSRRRAMLNKEEEEEEEGGVRIIDFCDQRLLIVGVTVKESEKT